jgi:ABC-type multidrug transport system permease subunit
MNQLRFIQQRRAINRGKLDPKRFERTWISDRILRMMVMVPWVVLASMILCPLIYFILYLSGVIQ